MHTYSNMHFFFGVNAKRNSEKADKLDAAGYGEKHPIAGYPARIT